MEWLKVFIFQTNLWNTGPELRPASRSWAFKQFDLKTQMKQTFELNWSVKAIPIESFFSSISVQSSGPKNGGGGGWNFFPPIVDPDFELDPPHVIEPRIECCSTCCKKTRERPLLKIFPSQKLDIFDARVIELDCKFYRSWPPVEWPSGVRRLWISRTCESSQEGLGLNPLFQEKILPNVDKI